MDAESVFVYGTLRTPRVDIPAQDTRYRPQVEAYVIDCKPATLSNAKLYDMGTFPAARPGEGVIVGELLTVTPRGLAEMDAIESHPYHYLREQVQVKTESGSVSAWVFWAPEPLVVDGILIQSGDWFDRADLVPPGTEESAGSVPVDVRKE